MLKARCREAVCGLSVGAVDACTAGRKDHENAVSGFDLFHSGPGTLDDSCALVPVYGRVLDREIPVPRMHVRLADSACRDADQYLAGPGSGKLNPLDMEGSAPLVNDGCCYL